MKEEPQSKEVKDKTTKGKSTPKKTSPVQDSSSERKKRRQTDDDGLNDSDEEEDIANNKKRWVSLNLDSSSRYYSLTPLQESSAVEESEARGSCFAGCLTSHLTEVICPPFQSCLPDQNQEQKSLSDERCTRTSDGGR